MAGVISLNNQNFKEQVLDEAGVVLVDFMAPWCGPCKMMAPVLEDLATEFEGRLIIAKVNVDENPELASQFGVMGVPTLILFKQGQKIESMVGFQPKNKLSALLETLI